MNRIAAIALLCLPTAPSPAAGQSVLERAAANVERFRKGDATIRLVGPDGSAIASVKVAVEQRAHDFPFGNLVRPRHYRDEAYLSRFEELFNFAELLEFNWGQYEPDEGRPLLRERLDFIDEWCRPHGVDRFYGHMLVWSSQYGEYPKTALPLWLFKYDPAAQRRLLEKRIRREVTDYRDVPILWDVVNEATHCRVWGDWGSPSYTAAPLDEVVPYVLDALRWAHEADPEARLLINDYRVIVPGTYRDRYRELLERLRAADAPLSAIGIQAHEPGKGTYWYTPEELWETCELFGEELGFPIYMTEFFYLSDPDEPIGGHRRDGNWSPEAQADAIEEFYRVCFGHPRVEGIVYFALSDRDVIIPTIGLLDEQYRPKPAWERLRRLIRAEWWTRASGTTGPDGTFRVRGFYGRHRVRVTHEGRTSDFEVHLREGDRNEWTLTIE